MITREIDGWTPLLLIVREGLLIDLELFPPEPPAVVAIIYTNVPGS